MPRKNPTKSHASRRHVKPPPAPVEPVVQPIQANAELPKTEQDTVSAQPNKHVIEQRRFARWMQSWSPIVLSFLVFIVIAIQAYISQKQWEAMLRQSELMNINLEEAKKTREIENRAYIGIQDAYLDAPTKNGHNPIITLKLVNAGKTPANRLNAIINCNWVESSDLIENGLPEFAGNPSITGLPSSQATMSPGVMMPLSATPALSDENRKAAIQAGFVLYTWGRIEYYDAFGNLRTTQFCFANEAKDSITFTSCAFHNQAD